MRLTHYGAADRVRQGWLELFSCQHDRAMRNGTRSIACLRLIKVTRGPAACVTQVSPQFDSMAWQNAADGASSRRHEC